MSQVRENTPLHLFLYQRDVVLFHSFVTIPHYVLYIIIYCFRVISRQAKYRAYFTLLGSGQPRVHPSALFNFNLLLSIVLFNMSILSETYRCFWMAQPSKRFIITGRCGGAPGTPPYYCAHMHHLGAMTSSRRQRRPWRRLSPPPPPTTTASSTHSLFYDFILSQPFKIILRISDEHKE